MPSISRDGIMQFPHTQLAQGKAPFTVYRYLAILSRIFLDAGVANPVKGIHVHAYAMRGRAFCRQTKSPAC